VITDVFISDMHLGHPGCRVTELLAYLQRRRGARLWLVGDVLDHPHIEPPPAHQDVLQEIPGRLFPEGLRPWGNGR
jgi:UDP-2,3-diacylglucosamine pyrophosphatase LpxH